MRCVDTRPARQSPEGRHRPRLVGERRRLLEKYGDSAFLLPRGTRKRPGVPAYPVISAKSGCYHCGMMRMAYTRIGAALNRTSNKSERNELLKARKKLIKLALEISDSRDRSNRCNFAIRASKRLKAL